MSILLLFTGGYTFLPVQAIAKLTKQDIGVLVTDHRNILMRIAKLDGTQPYTHLQPLTSDKAFKVDYINDINTKKYLGPYIHIHTMTGKTSPNMKLGFISNSKEVSYIYPATADRAGIFNYFKFYSNSKEQKPSSYASDHQSYETNGVAVEWRGSATRPYSTRRMPVDFFMLTELHYIYNCYTTSDRWMTSENPALTTAVGFR